MNSRELLKSVVMEACLTRLLSLNRVSSQQNKHFPMFTQRSLLAAGSLNPRPAQRRGSR